MRVLVCGGRDYNNYRELSEFLDNLCQERGWTVSDGNYHVPNWLPNVFIISGGAKGADQLAIDWAINNWCSFKEFPVDWTKHGKAAGPIRNQQMIDEGKPDIVIAFPGGRGTADMIKRAKKAGIEVVEYG